MAPGRRPLLTLALVAPVVLHGVELPMHAMHAVAPDELVAAGPGSRSNLYAETYYEKELECAAGCFAQPIRDDHAGIMMHHLKKAESFEDTAESAEGENRTKSYAAMYREIEIMYYELSRWDHVVRAVMEAQSTVVHGDPMFKVNGIAAGVESWPARRV